MKYKLNNKVKIITSKMLPVLIDGGGTEMRLFGELGKIIYLALEENRYCFQPFSGKVISVLVHDEDISLIKELNWNEEAL